MATAKRERQHALSYKYYTEANAEKAANGSNQVLSYAFSYDQLGSSVPDVREAATSTAGHILDDRLGQWTKAAIASQATAIRPPKPVYLIGTSTKREVGLGCC